MKDRRGEGGSFVIVRNCVEKYRLGGVDIFHFPSLPFADVGRCTDQTSPSFCSNKLNEATRGLG